MVDQDFMDAIDEEMLYRFWIIRESKIPEINRVYSMPSKHF